MAQADWTIAADSLGTGVVRRGATAGVAPPNGGGVGTYAFNSIDLTTGAVALFANQAGFAPTGSGGRVSGALKRLPSGGPQGFAPFLFVGLQGSSVNDLAYMLGLADDDPSRLVLKKGALTAGLANLAPDPTVNGVLMRSTEAIPEDTWVHLRLDVILQGSGDVIVQVFENDLDANPVSSPIWTPIAGMEGPLSPTIEGFVDDALGVNTGSVPLVGGRIGFGFYSDDVTRRGAFDHLQVARQT